MLNSRIFAASLSLILCALFFWGTLGVLHAAQGPLDPGPPCCCSAPGYCGYLVLDEYWDNWVCIPYPPGNNNYCTGCRCYDQYGHPATCFPCNMPGYPR